MTFRVKSLNIRVICGFLARKNGKTAYPSEITEFSALKRGSDGKSNKKDKDSDQGEEAFRD